MKTPRRINDLLIAKEKYLERAEALLDKSIVRYQAKLLSEYLQTIIPLLAVDEAGNILDNRNNSRLLQTTDKVFREFTKTNKIIIGGSMVKAFDNIARLGKKYFFETLTPPSFFDDVVKATQVLIDARLGIAGGNIVGGSFIDKLITNEELLMSLKNYMARSLSERTPVKSFVAEINKMITGAGEDLGACQKYFKRHARDLYMQYDASYNLSIANKLGLNYFIYQGGLIRDSRDFCVAHNGKVWSREEAALWPEWIPSFGEYPEGYKIKAKNTDEIPSYINFPGYSPLIDRGGYNCRHILGWIPDELADRMRGKKSE